MPEVQILAPEDGDTVRAGREADGMVNAAKTALAQEVVEARQTLAGESEALAEEIVAALLELVRQIFAPNGLTEGHFGWPANATRQRPSQKSKAR